MPRIYKTQVIQVVTIDGVQTRAKKCNGPLCQGEWVAVTDFYPRHCKNANKEAVASYCKKCQAYRHRQRFAKGKWKGVCGRIPIRQLAPFVDELVSKCGNSTVEAARLAGVSRDALNDMRKEKYETVYANTAKGVLEALLIARNPAYKPPPNVAPWRLKPSARQMRLREADCVEDRGDLLYPLDTEAAA